MSPQRTVRIDYEPGDPDAPAPTSRVPGAAVIVVDEQDRVLMIQRTDSGTWALPGGAHDIGESLPQTAVRECHEETGVTIELDGLVGTFTNPQHVFEYRGDRPEIRQEFSVVFTGHLVAGEPHPTSEASRVEWIPDDQLDQLDITTAIRERIHAWRTLRHAGTSHLG